MSDCEEKDLRVGRGRTEREIGKDGEENIKRAERRESWDSVKSECMRCSYDDVACK